MHTVTACAGVRPQAAVMLQAGQQWNVCMGVSVLGLERCTSIHPHLVLPFVLSVMLLRGLNSRSNCRVHTCARRRKQECLVTVLLPNRCRQLCLAAQTSVVAETSHFSHTLLPGLPNLLLLGSADRLARPALDIDQHPSSRVDHLPHSVQCISRAKLSPNYTLFSRWQDYRMRRVIKGTRNAAIS